MIMKVFALAFLVALCAADDDHAESTINLKDIIKKPPSNQLGNDGGKNLKCWECTTNTTMEPDESSIQLALTLLSLVVMRFAF